MINGMIKSKSMPAIGNYVPHRINTNDSGKKKVNFNEHVEFSN